MWNGGFQGLERERGREDGAQIKHENSSDFPESGKNK